MGDDAAGGGGRGKRLVVAFVLAGVGGSELGDGLIEDVRAAEVGGDGDGITGTGVQNPPVRDSRQVRAAGRDARAAVSGDAFRVLPER